MGAIAAFPLGFCASVTADFAPETRREVARGRREEEGREEGPRGEGGPGARREEEEGEETKPR